MAVVTGAVFGAIVAARATKNDDVDAGAVEISCSALPIAVDVPELTRGRVTFPRAPSPLTS